MVRFKNRWLLVEFLFPEEYEAASNIAVTDIPLPSFEASRVNDHNLAEQNDSEDEVDNMEHDPTGLPLTFYPPLATRPLFVVPSNPVILTSTASSSVTTPQKTLGSRLNEKAIWAGIKGSVIDMTGDQGWGKVGSSLGGVRVNARVVCCSGTVKKLQLSAIRYSRAVVAGYLAQAVDILASESAKQAEIAAWTQRKQMIEDDLAKLEES